MFSSVLDFQLFPNRKSQIYFHLLETGRLSNVLLSRLLTEAHGDAPRREIAGLVQIKVRTGDINPPQLVGHGGCWPYRRGQLSRPAGDTQL